MNPAGSNRFRNVSKNDIYNEVVELRKQVARLTKLIEFMFEHGGKNES